MPPVGQTIASGQEQAGLPAVPVAGTRASGGFRTWQVVAASLLTVGAIALWVRQPGGDQSQCEAWKVTRVTSTSQVRLKRELGVLVHDMDAKTKFELINELIHAVAALLWPIVLLTIILWFRRDLSAIFFRLRRGKFFGQEIEMDPAIDELQASMGKAAQSLQGVPEPLAGTAPVPSHECEFRQIVSIEAGNPELSLLALSSVLENELTILVASMGYLPRTRKLSAPQAVEMLSEKRFLPAHAIDSIKMFWNLRNQIIHGRKPTDEREIVRVIDIGKDLLQLARLVPHETNVVACPPVELFADEACTQLRPDAKGLVLETTAPRSELQSTRIFPTTEPEYYEVGKRVTWEWNMGRVWGKTWWKDPDTGEPLSAWASAGEFVGRHTDDLP